MAVRASMAALITRTRDRIRDPNPGGGVVPHFGDQEIQDALDVTRATARLLPLVPAATYTTAGLQWLTYLAPVGDWETDATVQNNAYALLVSPTDYTFDDLTGTVTLASSLFPPLWLNGQTYDVALAAANLLERWADDLDLTDVDFKADGTQMALSQRPAGKRRAAAHQRTQARVGHGALGGDGGPYVNTDYASAHRIGGYRS